MDEQREAAVQYIKVCCWGTKMFARAAPEEIAKAETGLMLLNRETKKKERKHCMGTGFFVTCVDEETGEPDYDHKLGGAFSGLEPGGLIMFSHTDLLEIFPLQE